MQSHRTPRSARQPPSARTPASAGGDGAAHSTVATASAAASVAPAFASPLPARPSTVPTQLRTIADGDSRPASRPASRQQQTLAPRSGGGIARPSAAAATPPHLDSPDRSAFSFSDPHANELFYAASIEDGDDGQTTPRRKQLQQQPRAASATPARMLTPTAPSNPRPMPPFSAGPLSATEFASHWSSPRSILRSAQRPTADEAHRFDSTLGFGRAEPARFTHSPRAPSTDAMAGDRVSLPREFERVRGLDFEASPRSNSRARDPRTGFEELSDGDEYDASVSDSKTQEDGARQFAKGNPSPTPRTRIHAERHAPMSSSQHRESWSAAARGSIPLQYERSLSASASSKAPRTLAQIRDDAAKLMHRDSMQLYKLAHASERERREQRDKPWRENCALEDESHTAPLDPVAPVAQPASANDPAYRELSDRLTGLLAQHAHTQAMLKQQRAQSRLSALFAARLEERRVEREREVLLLRSDEASDDALAEALRDHQASMKAGLPPPASALRCFGSHLIEDDEDFLAQSRDPLAKLVVQLNQAVSQTMVWDQIMTQLLEEKPPARRTAAAGSALPLLTKPLRLLLGRVHAHHQSVTAPLSSLLQLLVQKMTEDRKFKTLMAAGGDRAAAEEIATTAGQHGRNASIMSNTSAASASASSHARTGSGILTSVSAMSARIHSLQHAHLRKLEEQLGAEYRTSLQLSQDLQHTKENISAKVSLGIFRQQYTKLTQRKAAELAASSSGSNNAAQSQQQQLGAGSAGGNPDHTSRHHFDYDVRSKSIVSASAPLPDGVAKRYLEDDIEHALVDEDPSASGTHYVGAVSDVVDKRVHAAATLAADDATLHPHLAEVDPRHLKHMPAMHEFIASFKQGGDGTAGALIPGANASASDLADAAGAKARATRSAALQTLLTRPVLRIHSLSNGDVVHGQVGYHSYYYVFKLSGTENGAFIRVIQHPSDVYEEFGRRPQPQEEPPFDPAHPEVDRDLRAAHALQESSPSAAEDDANFLDVYLNPMAPPTRLAHTHKATTKGQGMCSLDLRAPSQDTEGEEGWSADQKAEAKAARKRKKHGRSTSEDDDDNIKTLEQLLVSSSASRSTLYSTSSLWFLRVIGRGMRPKGFTLEFRTNTEVLDYSSVFNRLIRELDDQSQWAEGLTEKMMLMDSTLAEFLPQPADSRNHKKASTFASSTKALMQSSSSAEDDAAVAGPISKDVATQTHVVALNDAELEASLLRKEEDAAAAQLASEARQAEELKSTTLSLGILRDLFTYPLAPRKQLRLWSQSALLTMITSIYRDKLKYDAEHPEAATPALDAASSPSRKQSFTEFVLRFFKERYGQVRPAELYCYELIHSIEMKHMHLARAQLFARLMRVLAPCYEEDDIAWFFSTPLRALWSWQARFSVVTADNEQGQALLPYSIVEATLWDCFSAQSFPSPLEMQTEQDPSGARLRDVCLSAWINNLLLRLRSHLIIRDSVESDGAQSGPSSGQLSHRKSANNKPSLRSYWVDSDAFLTLVMDAGRPSRFRRTIGELQQTWKRMFQAHELVQQREQQEGGGNAEVASDGPRANAAPQSKLSPTADRAALRTAALQIGSSSSASDVSRFSARSCLYLPDWLGVMRIEFPHLDELELYLLFVECSRAGTSQPQQQQPRAGEESVSIEGFLRGALRYGISDMAVAAPEAIAAPPPVAAAASSSEASSLKQRAGRADSAAASSSRSPSPSLDAVESTRAPLFAAPFPSVSQLHLSTHRLPYPACVLPGFKQLKSAAASKSNSGSKKGSTPRAAIAIPKFVNASSLVWDDLAAARLLPAAANATGAAAGRPESVHRPPNMVDRSPFLPPSMLPPLRLKSLQSLRLLTSLHALLHPLLLAHLARIQHAWSTVPEAFETDELAHSRSKLAKVYALLSDLQLHLETRKRKPGALSSPIADAFAAGVGNEEPTSSTMRSPLQQPHRPLKLKRSPAELEDRLYESAPDDDSADSDDQRNGGKRVSMPKWPKAESDALLRLCWSTFRAVLFAASDLLVSHSPLYADLLRLTCPDGRPLVSREFAGGDVHRAFAHAKQ